MSTVLIVEDVELNRELLVQILEDEYSLLIATDGEEAVSVARDALPDVILMDLSLPRVDGFEATRRIKENPDTAHIPIIAVTAHAMRGDEDKARAGGCDDYVSKPVDEELLLEKLQAVLSCKPE